MFSSDRERSSVWPARYSEPATEPCDPHSQAPNASASASQATDHRRDARIEGASRRPSTRKSTASIATTRPARPAHMAAETSSELPPTALEDAASSEAGVSTKPSPCRITEKVSPALRPMAPDQPGRRDDASRRGYFPSAGKVSGTPITRVLACGAS